MLLINCHQQRSITLLINFCTTAGNVELGIDFREFIQNILLSPEALIFNGLAGRVPGPELCSRPVPLSVHAPVEVHIRGTFDALGKPVYAPLVLYL